jgi:hypothetical protein
MSLKPSVTNKPFMLSVVKLNDVMLSVIMLSVVMLNVIMLNVVAPFYNLFCLAVPPQHALLLLFM